ncbi:MAG: hypothetical protein QNK63_10215 [Flavobacteriales bacterium]|jgi:hypothetical protein
MKHEDQRLSFINSTMNIVNNLCADIYEAMVDEEYDDAVKSTTELVVILQELNQTLSDEI